MTDGKEVIRKREKKDKLKFHRVTRKQSLILVIILLNASTKFIDYRTKETESEKKKQNRNSILKR